MDDLGRIAGHEAGHAVAAIVCGLKIDRATIDPATAGPGNAGCIWSTPNHYDCSPLEAFSDVPLHEIAGGEFSFFTQVFCYARTIEMQAASALIPPAGGLWPGSILSLKRASA
jgi:hypothetical protein